jgi:predicted RNase H-like nuclease (RuvC/YqgF family)
MQLTPPSANETKMYGSESNIHEMKDQTEYIANWVNPRKKRMIDDTESGSSSNSQVPAVQKTSCCSEKTISTIKEVMDSFREEMKIMMLTLADIKNQQEERFTSFQRDITEIKTTIDKLQKTNVELDQSVDYLGRKCSEFESTNREWASTIKTQENKINDLEQKNVYLDKCNKALEERVCSLEQMELGLQCGIDKRTCSRRYEYHTDSKIRSRETEDKS